MSSMIEALQTYIAACPALSTLGGAIHVDEISGDVPGFSLVPMPGARVLSTDVLGNRETTYPFALMSRVITVDDYARIEAAGAFEDFAEWLDDQTDAGDFPDFGTGKAVESIAVTSWGYLYQQAENAQTGVYQIVCAVNYAKKKG